MTGGILQLVARGIEDLFIVGQPVTTFFKTAYRRHTNFSRGEFNINFTSRLEFGKETKSKIHRWGDLLHRLFLVIKLPKIDIVFRSLSIEEVINELANSDITWNTNRDPNEIFDDSSEKDLIITTDPDYQLRREDKLVLFGRDENIESFRNI